VELYNEENTPPNETLITFATLVKQPLYLIDGNNHS